MLRRVPTRTRIWVDEAYIGYAGLDQSLASSAADAPNLVVCTSMSKMYALSGMRVAYLVSDSSTAASLRPMDAAVGGQPPRAARRGRGPP
jgi:histidinol-phosphate/aromatic aminotransferase/cobyric acid decarboxylase-like protein